MRKADVGYRLKQEQLASCREKARISAGFFVLPTSVSTSAEPRHLRLRSASESRSPAASLEDIITGLSRSKSLFVIARNSSFTYKGKAVDIKQVGRELGVRYVLEGSGA